MKTVAYYRSSTSFQENSIETQKHQAQMCAVKNSLVIEKEYVDEAVSARKKKLSERPSMFELLKDIQDGKIKNLIVYKRDRLARNVSEYMKIFSEIKNHKVNVFCAAENEFEMRFDPVGEFYELIMAAYSEREGDTIIKRIMETKQALVDQDLIPSGRPALGYKADPANPGKWQFNYQTIGTVGQVINEFMKQPYKNLSSFTEHLVNKGIKPIGKGDWSYQKVEGILTNPIYKGVYNITILDDSFQINVPDLAILTETQWDKVQQRLKDTKRKKAENSKIEPDFHLKKLLKCAYCGEKMKFGKKTKRGEVFLFYTCKEHKEIKVDLDFFHKEVIREVEKFFHSLHDTSFKDFYLYFKEIDEKSLKRAIDDINNQLNEHLIEIKQLTEAWLKNGMDDEIKKELLGNYNCIEILNYGLNQFQSELNHISAFPERLDEIKKRVSSKIMLKTFDDKKILELLETFVEQIILYPNSAFMTFYNPYHKKIEGGMFSVELEW